MHRARITERLGRASLIAGLLVALACAADTGAGTDGASAHLRLRVVVPPVFRVLAVEPTDDGAFRYRVWTNVREVLIDGRSQRFTSVGESTLVLDTPPDRLLVQYAH